MWKKEDAAATIEKGQNAYDTEYSQTVSHSSTNSAQCCLTSVIGRELVFSTWCGRRQYIARKLTYQKSLIKQKPSFVNELYLSRENSFPKEAWFFFYIKVDIVKKRIAPGEARTHGLQIMRLTRCLLRYRGTVYIRLIKNIFRWLMLVKNIHENMRQPGIEPGSTAWKAAMLTTIPLTLVVCE